MRAVFAELPVAFWCVIALIGSAAVATPPVVSKATPDNGDIDVDPTTREMRVTFDQPMSRGGFSVVGGGETYPVAGGKPRWRSSRTVVIPLRLEPNREYWLSINSDRFQNFRSKTGEPATPYPISFRTGAGGDSSPAESMRENAASAVDEMIAVMTELYSYRDRLGIDWKERIEGRRRALESAKGAKEFAGLAVTLLAKAEDKHLWVRVGDKTAPTFIRPSTPNINRRLLPNVVPNWKLRSKAVASGRWEDGIGYLYVHTWSRDAASDLDAAFDTLLGMQDAPALVIDVRSNGGGDERLARSLAGCFVDTPKLYAQHVIVDPDAPAGFSDPMQRMLQPNKERGRFSGKVAVLIGPAVMSSNEAFVLMMRAAGATLVGAATQGSSGNPQPHDLGNGVTLLVPSWKAMTADGEEFEGVGVKPDVAVDATVRDFRSSDPVIEAALKSLRE